MKSGAGNFFEDFRIGRRFAHAPSRTLTEGDAALYRAIYGSRFALQASDPFAKSLGYRTSPLDDFLVFHTVFGMSVADISLNAVANLGYAELRLGKPLYAGATLSALSEVIGLRQNSDGKTGIVYVRTEGLDETGDTVVSFIRWVMVRKRDAASPAPEASIPSLREAVTPDALVAHEGIDFSAARPVETGSAFLWDDYAPGDRIDHIDGVTIEDADHMMAARLYHNNARVHFNHHAESAGRFGRRIVYGGHVISLARALSFNGLQNALCIAAVNGGRHVHPVFAGDTIYAWSEVLAKAPIPDANEPFRDRRDCAALRLRLVATKNLPCGAFPDRAGDGYPETVVLDLDYWAVMPRR